MVILVSKDTLDRPGLDDVAERYDPDEEAEKQLYRSEIARLESFVDWPINSPVNKADLAKEGFYYLGVGDRVRCVFCFAELEQFEVGDIVSEEHRKFSPRCPFVKLPGYRVGNIPITPNSYSRLQCVHKFPAYTNTVDRLKTFEDWPKAMKQRPRELAAAGFYYKGRGDIVQCFSCGGIVKNWEVNDEPWAEHKRHFPRCHFMRENDLNHVSTPVKQELRRQFSFSLTRQAVARGYSEFLIEKYKEHKNITGSEWPSNFDLETLIAELERFKVQPETCSEVNDKIEPVDEVDYGPCRQCLARGSCGTFNCGHCVCCEDCGIDVDRCPECGTTIRKIHHSVSTGSFQNVT